MIKGQGDGRISKNDAEILWNFTMDGNRVTNCENKTLEYILKKYNFTDCGRQLLEDKLNTYKHIEIDESKVNHDQISPVSLDNKLQVLPSYNKIDKNKDRIIDSPEFEVTLGNKSSNINKNNQDNLVDVDELMAETDSDSDLD